jgi:hypothetical protein
MFGDGMLEVLGCTLACCPRDELVVLIPTSKLCMLDAGSTSKSVKLFQLTLVPAGIAMDVYIPAWKSCEMGFALL